MIKKTLMPIIAITARCESDETFIMSKDYLSAIKDAGGIPIIIPPLLDANEIDELLSKANGILVPGGNDINPKLYGETPDSSCSQFVPIRDSFEPIIIRETLSRDIPFLGVCRGAQMLNVALGGTLNQSIKTETINHWQQEPYDKPKHLVKLIPNGKLNQIVTTNELSVNSIHHQSINQLGRDVEIEAIAPDGIIESISYSPNRFAIGVQWHPEMLHNDISSRLIFKAFVETARKPKYDSID